MGEKRPFVSAIVVAAGSASRMEGIDKQLCDIGGLPCIGRSMLAFQQCRDITGIVVVTRQDLFSPGTGHRRRPGGVDKLRHIVAGGKSRQQSVAAGVACLPESCQYIAVHDGARPLVRPDCITEVLADAVTYGAATAAVPVKDTIKVPEEAALSTPPPTGPPSMLPDPADLRGRDLPPRHRRGPRPGAGLHRRLPAASRAPDGASTSRRGDYSKHQDHHAGRHLALCERILAS